MRIFVVGLVLWLATVLVTFATENSNLIPTIILLGSFLIPITFVVYAFERADEVITAQRIFSAFVYAVCSVCWGPPSWNRRFSVNRLGWSTLVSG